jgi:phage repressor protein C with HTH and peptisase S24 domain
MESMQTDNADRALVSEPSATEKQKNETRNGRDTADTEKSPEKGAEAKASEQKKSNGEQLSEEDIKKVDELKSRDQEVRIHEQAHAAVGGQHAGAPSYGYERGPDGKSYVVSGEVQIDVSPVQGDPQATIQKMQVVRRAALAPAQPSSADRAIAADATAKATQARAELAQQQIEGEPDDQGANISINAPSNKSLEGEGDGTEEGKKTLSSPERGEMIASFYDQKVRPSVDSFSATA